MRGSFEGMLRATSSTLEESEQGLRVLQPFELNQQLRDVDTAFLAELRELEPANAG